MWLQNIKSCGNTTSKFFINWKLYQVSYRHIPHFSQWYGFLSMLIKCLQIAQKYADILFPHLRHLALSPPIWKEMIWKIMSLTDQVSENYDHKVLNIDYLIYQTEQCSNLWPVWLPWKTGNIWSLTLQWDLFCSIFFNDNWNCVNMCMYNTV